MLTINLDDFMIELKEGTVKHVGASTTSAEIKLYDVTDAEAREFGDRIKLGFEDDEGNAVEVAIDGEELDSIASDIEEVL